MTASSEAEELDTVHGFSWIPRPAVMTLILANTLVFFALPVLFRNRFPYRVETLGAVWGPLVFDGQWWRVLTCIFVHFQFAHLFFNMFGLWILGVYVERDYGSVAFLLSYMFCGVAVALSTLALRPDVVSYGSSGAVVGLAGELISLYGVRLRRLRWRTRCKLALLILYAASLVWRELSRGDLYIPHTVGVLSGVFVGLWFVFTAKAIRSRLWTFLGMTLLLVSAATFVQRNHL